MFASRDTVPPEPMIILHSYANYTGSPIRIESGESLTSMAPGYFINEYRYGFYRKLHKLAMQGELGGQEREILESFGSFIEDSAAFSENLSVNTEKLLVATESLKKANKEVEKLKIETYKLSENNERLKEQLNVLEKSSQKKGKWILPTSIGIIIGTFSTLLVK